MLRDSPSYWPLCYFCTWVLIQLQKGLCWCRGPSGRKNSGEFSAREKVMSHSLINLVRGHLPSAACSRPCFCCQTAWFFHPDSQETDPPFQNPACLPFAAVPRRPLWLQPREPKHWFTSQRQDKLWEDLGSAMFPNKQWPSVINEILKPKCTTASFSRIL